MRNAKQMMLVALALVGFASADAMACGGFSGAPCASGGSVTRISVSFGSSFGGGCGSFNSCGGGGGYYPPVVSPGVNIGQPYFPPQPMPFPQQPPFYGGSHGGFQAGGYIQAGGGFRAGGFIQGGGYGYGYGGRRQCSRHRKFKCSGFSKTCGGWGRRGGAFMFKAKGRFGGHGKFKVKAKGRW